jgi:hypothetical protein
MTSRIASAHFAASAWVRRLNGAACPGRWHSWQSIDQLALLRGGRLHADAILVVDAAPVADAPLFIEDERLGAAFRAEPLDGDSAGVSQHGERHAVQARIAREVARRLLARGDQQERDAACVVLLGEGHDARRVQFRQRAIDGEEDDHHGLAVAVVRETVRLARRVAEVEIDRRRGGRDAGAGQRQE